MGSLVPQPLWWLQIHGVGPTPTPFHFITTAASVRLGVLIHSSFKKLSHLCHGSRLKDICCKNVSQFKGINLLQLSNDAIASTCSKCLYFFNDGEIGKDRGIEGASNIGGSRRNSFNGRKWTNILLAINVIFDVAQMASQGKLLLWGAKINSLIDKGQFWRLLTSSVLHANVGHLMVNCYSLNSIGPTVENLVGPGRFLAVHPQVICSAKHQQWVRQGRYSDYVLDIYQSPDVGYILQRVLPVLHERAGSRAVFVLRHGGIIRGGTKDLHHLARVILLNMMGGLLGGVASSWLVGPAWKYESLATDGRRIFVDRAPIKYLSNRKRDHRRLR